MKKGILLALVLALFVTDFAEAGPFWWLRRRRRTYTTYNTTPPPPANVGVDTPVSYSGVSLDVVQEMHAVDTEYRTNNGLNGCILHSKLCEVAQAHAENMARHHNMSHNLGGSPWNRAYRAGWPNSASENIAAGYNSVRAAYGGWWWSRGHRRNMLGNHTYVGFGYAVSSTGRRYWAAMYSK